MFYKKFTIESIKTALLCMVFALALTACGGGESNSSGNNTTIAVQFGCGSLDPAPGTVLNSRFCSELWLKDTMQNNCAGCHQANAGSPQTPYFMDGRDAGENINLAADSLLKPAVNLSAGGKLIVDLANPSQSYMVQKMTEGHNCWASPSVCADIVQGYIEQWAGSSIGGREIQLSPPTNANPPGGGKDFPTSATVSTDSSDPNVTFEQVIYNPLLRTYCQSCHDQGPGDPLFADGDVNNSFVLSQPRMNLDDPASSRYVIKLLTHTQGCWDANVSEVDPVYQAIANTELTGDDCNDSSVVMKYAITKYAAGIPTNVVDTSLFLISRATSLPDGIVASGGSRHETDQIALYEFKTGQGDIAFDSSGAGTALDLSLEGGITWQGGWGISINSAGDIARASATNTKLYDMIQLTGEYSVEAWVAPNNVTQEMARIVNYSGGGGNKNFALSQTLYNYDSQVRNNLTGLDGEAALSTPDADEVLQATLQHVVTTYDATGRKIYVNGQLRVEGPEIATGGSINNWNPGYSLVLGDELGAANDDNLWKGVIKMVSIHNRSLTLEQVQQNFAVGVGEKFFLLFDISHIAGVPTQSYIVFTVSQFDNYSYLFTDPKYVSLNPAITNVNIPLKGIRIGINSNPAAAGQAYINIDKTAVPIATNGEQLSNIGTTIQLERGADLDEFYLIFEELGTENRTYLQPTYAGRSYPNLPAASDIGLKTFDQINATFAAMTGISTQASADLPGTENDYDISAAYSLVKQQLPSSTDINTFVTAHNIGIAQLGIEYCQALVVQEAVQGQSTILDGFNFSQTATSAAANASDFIDPLLNAMNGVGMDLQMDSGGFLIGGTVPDASGDTFTTKSELIYLANKLNQCIGTTCSNDAAQTQAVVKAVCTAALANANTLIQ